MKILRYIRKNDPVSTVVSLAAMVGCSLLLVYFWKVSGTIVAIIFIVNAVVLLFWVVALTIWTVGHVRLKFERYLLKREIRLGEEVDGKLLAAETELWLLRRKRFGRH